MDLVSGAATDPLRLGALEVGVGEQDLRGSLRDGGGLGILDLLVDDGTDLLLDALDVLLRADIEVEETLLHAGDDVAVGAHLLDLLTRTVGGAGVRHGVAAVTVGLVLENDGAVASEAELTGELGAGIDGEHVHGVHLETRDVLATLVELREGRGARGRGAHTVLVVLTSKNAGDVPQLGHVVGLEHLALVGGTVAVQGVGDIGLLLVHVAESEAETKRDLGTDNAVASVEVLGVHVHRATFALGHTGGAAHELGKDGVHGRAAHVLETVAAVGRDDAVAFVAGLVDANGHGLLAGRQMAETVDLLGLVERIGSHFETANKHHLAEHVQQLLLREVDLELGLLLAKHVVFETVLRERDLDVIVGSTGLVAAHGSGTECISAHFASILRKGGGRLDGQRTKAQHPV